MTQTERAAYNAGIKAAINAAQIVAITIETAEDAGAFRKRVAAEALAAFAESAKGLMLEAFPADGHCLNADQNSASLMMAKE
ncbi:hypothetical protein ASF41_21585 [Methylobacterium sp. Leaf111]|uniref:hypothetical protein n=1 Tax=Methylobacterium sp. Leaf111 TaxID=1736257 RepID=UPI0006F61539|nr:hypothetical protein [Methylobacterium sp. Leaf111]KQP67663.1 hypothetical protein ASF41_21585 [Methylobacterium sp. Leaf111]